MPRLTCCSPKVHRQEELKSQEELEPHSTVTLWAEVRCGGTACAPGELHCRERGCAEESGREGEDGGCPLCEGAAQMDAALPGCLACVTED